jgi:hypothetical protein
VATQAARGEQLEQLLGSTLGGPWPAHPAAQLLERRLQLRPLDLQPAHLAHQGLGLQVVLHQLREYGLAQDHIGQAHDPPADHQPRQPVGEPGEAIHDHRWTAQQGRLQRGRAGTHQPGIRGRQQVVGIARHHRQGQAAAAGGLAQEGLIHRGGPQQHGLPALRLEQLGSPQQLGQQHLNLTAAAARHQHQQGLVGVEAMGPAGLQATSRHRQAVQQRMAHVAGEGTAVAVEDRLLKRKDHRQPIDETGHAPGPAPPPGPHLGRDVEEHRNATAMGLAGHQLIEAGIVHQHHGGRPVAVHTPLQPAHHPPVTGNAGDDLHQAGGRELGHVDAHVHAGGTQLGAANADHLQVGPLPAEGLHQMPAMEVA